MFPNLSRMAFDCCSIPLLSDDPKRTFSSAKPLITDRRDQLNEDIIEANEFLRSWYGSEPEDEEEDIPVKMPTHVRIDTNPTTPLDDETFSDSDATI